jgi:hypothetical protein
MLTTIPEADIAKASVNSISVGSVGIGPVTIGQLVITDLEMNTAADGAFLRNFVVTVTYNMKLDWHLHIELPGNVIDDSGTEDLDSPTFIIGFGDIRLPGLENLKIDIASLAIDSPSATSLPITNIQLGKAIAQGIQTKNLKLPTAGFSLSGLGLGTLNVAGFGAPAATVETATIAKVNGDTTPFGQMALSNLGLPASQIPDIVAQGVDSTATPKPKAFHLDMGCLDLVLKVNPTAQAHIDQFIIRNVKASGSIGKIELHNVVAPYELLNVTLSQIGIETISVPAVAIA